ncbi:MULTISPECIES: class I SAM-dependent methyltransferase [Staphylococcus]|uniref:class I SAM-dependent methyltransferase n=1 Tax=Staphylococcus TaxID=1279 RepID=UPI000CD2AB3F|nr:MULTISPECIES: class I SAM-dependent methyltransferase [Staphylococcus]POA05867.1 16S rRNA methyltransferase [Staphylococcus caprae]SUL96449.1 16S rRNA methyltransferase [Staphylococcus caprae]HCG75197.1 class I SAM-dependent methyltransferase [Staphylococcus sp.]
MGHYYDENPEVKSNQKKISYHFDKTRLEFTTDAGVFSKDKVDFGSDLLIQTFLKEHPPGPSKYIADVGCGYGPIGLTIAKISPHHQLSLLDVNNRALALAEINKTKNQIENAEIIESDCLSAVDNQRFDYVLTNPPIRAGKDIVHRIFEEAYEKLKAQGELYVVIQKKQGMPSAKKKMEALFNNVEVVNKSKGYYILKSSKG